MKSAWLVAAALVIPSAVRPYMRGRDRVEKGEFSL